MLEKKLNNIFKYYRRKYKLETKLCLERGYKCVFNTIKNYISYDMDWLEDRNVVGVNLHSIKENLIFSLLHEIKHAIDWEYNRKFCKKQKEEINWGLYHSDMNYALSLPIEKRAHEFARKELKKWIKC